MELIKHVNASTKMSCINRYGVDFCEIGVLIVKVTVLVVVFWLVTLSALTGR
jgi:hypothetical protein